MNVHEFALLFAVAAPVATLAGLNVFLHAAGERGTGLLPGFMRFPSTPIETAAVEAVAEPVVTLAPANDEFERQAA